MFGSIQYFHPYGHIDKTGNVLDAKIRNIEVKPTFLRDVCSTNIERLKI